VRIVPVNAESALFVPVSFPSLAGDFACFQRGWQEIGKKEKIFVCPPLCFSIPASVHIHQDVGR